MGTDISGWVEYWSPDSESWVGIIKLAPLVSDRNYELFGWLFGVPGRTNAMRLWNGPPVAARRGLPTDACQEAGAEYTDAVTEYPDEFYGATWISWREIQAAGWDERIEDRVLESRTDTPERTRAFYWRDDFLQAKPDIAAQVRALQPGQSLAVGDKIYRVRTMRRRDILEPEWELLFRLIEMLEARIGNPEHLRLVVWFND